MILGTVLNDMAAVEFSLEALKLLIDDNGLQ